MKLKALGFAIVIVLAGGLSGCFGKKDNVNAADANEAVNKFLDNSTRSKIEDRLASVPKNYTFAGQQLLASVSTYLNGTVDPGANAAVEDRNDRAGNHYNYVRQMSDVSAFIPVGQPTEIRVTLAYANQPGNSAKCDIAVDVPGRRTSYYAGNNEEMNWKFSVSRTVVNTVGVAGAPHEVGVECANGRITSGLDYSIRLDFSYERDVLTPYHPYAFTVPANATGVIFESAKAGGPEHLDANFLVIGPSDELVAYVEFNDIAVPTESVFVPTAEKGEYVFYALNMTGGFLRMRADAPVDERAVRVLELKEDRVVDATGPAPGVVARNWYRGDATPTGALNDAVVTPATGGTTSSFSVDGAFPLRIEAFIGDAAAGSKTLMSDVRILSSKGLVASLQRVLRSDDERGSLGLSQDELNRVFNGANLAKGAYTVEIVNDSPDAAVGHVVTTYVR